MPDEAILICAFSTRMPGAMQTHCGDCRAIIWGMPGAIQRVAEMGGGPVCPDCAAERIASQSPDELQMARMDRFGKEHEDIENSYLAKVVLEAVKARKK
jgi:hypothetical protein